MDELPPPHWTMTSGGMEAWNADQMREYGRACERAAYERAAQVAGKTVCDRHIPTGVTIYGTAAAAAIRKLGAEK